MLTRDAVLSPPTNASFGDYGIVEVGQDAVGGRTLSMLSFGLGGEGILNNAGNTANKRAILKWFRNGTGGTYGQGFHVEWTGRR